MKNSFSTTFYQILKQVVFDSWWVIAFIIGCIFLFEKSLENRADLHKQLSQQYLSLLKEKEDVLNEQKELERQVNSQTDVSWIELILMKELSLVPENQTKVYFYPAKLD